MTTKIHQQWGDCLAMVFAIIAISILVFHIYERHGFDNFEREAQYYYSKQTKIQIAKKMLSKKYSVKQIKEITGLTAEEIKGG